MDFSNIFVFAYFCLSLLHAIRYQIIKYPDSFAYTYDLADSIHGRGELSNHCMEVGIEFLWRTNNVEGKLIVSFQISIYLMNREYHKKAVVSLFKRTPNYSLSVMKQVITLVFFYVCTLLCCSYKLFQYAYYNIFYILLPGFSITATSKILLLASVNYRCHF
jgi:hypothetical protein